MIEFILKSVLCLALLSAFYSVFLERQKMPQFNRFYLIGILIFSVVIPTTFLGFESSLSSPINSLSAYASQVVNPSRYLNFFLVAYLVVSTGFLVKFVVSIISIFITIRKSPSVIKEGIIYVLIEDKILPHTFLNYVFLNKEDYLSNSIEDELFTHELTHVKQKHSIDVLIVEILQIFIWFNPVLYFVKKSIRLNHEYIADDTVINTYEDRAHYQRLLLKVATWNNGNSLTSNLNYSLTKKRFKMMVKKGSLRSNRITQFSAVFLLSFFVLLFANNMNVAEGEGEHHEVGQTSVSNERHNEKEKSHSEHPREKEHTEERHQ